MIVRIHGVGQWKIDQSDLDQLNVIDADVAAAIQAQDADKLRQELERLTDAVKSMGTPVHEDEIAESELILPGVDVSLEEIGQWLNEEQPEVGLIAD